MVSLSGELSPPSNIDEQFRGGSIGGYVVVVVLVLVCQVGYSWVELTTFCFIERHAHTFGEVTGQASSHVKCGDVIVPSRIVEAYPPFPPTPVGEYLREN